MIGLSKKQLDGVKKVFLTLPCGHPVQDCVEIWHINAVGEPYKREDYYLCSKHKKLKN